MTPTSPDREATLADPGAIDLDEVPDLLERLLEWQRFEKTGWNHDAIKDARAAIEALREGIKITKGNFESEAFFWKERAEAAEARVVELEGALQQIMDMMHQAPSLAPDEEAVEAYHIARTVLAATPAEALERARAVEAELIAFKIAFGDALDAMDFAASEGFEWPKDPITANVRHVLDTYADRGVLGKEGG